MLKQALLLFSFILYLNSFSQTRYWVAGAGANWSGDNWAATSGGATDGGGPPTALQSARFDANGLGNCTVDVLDPSIAGLVVNGFTGIIDLNGNTVTSSGTVTFATGTINDTPGTDSLVVNSTATTRFSGTTFGALVKATSARIYLDGSIFNALATFTKNGAGNDVSAGGNTFAGNANFTNTGSGYFMLGNISPDTFDLDVNITNSGTNSFYIGNNSTGNLISGNLTATNSATGAARYIYISNGASASINIDGNVSVTNSGSASDLRAYLGNSGDVTIGGDLALTNSGSGTAARIYMASAASSSVSISGNTTVSNSGGSTTKRIYLGNNGDVVFTGTLAITNSSTATNSEVYCNNTTGSVNSYGGNITIEATSTSTDGVLFGSAGGSGTLAATRTLSIGGGGFIGRFLTLRNFTQTGATAHTLIPTGTTTYLTIYDCNWGGDVVFSSPQILTRGTTYSGTASLTKTGATDNQSAGGNTFIGNAVLANSGSGYFLMGNGSPDTFDGNLDLNNSGTRHLYLAYNSAGNTIAGDLTVTNTGTGTSYIYLSDLVASTLTVTGTTVITNSGSGSAVNTYVGDDGDITFNSGLTLMNSASGTAGHIYVANTANSTVTVTGNTVATNSGVGGTKRIYLGTAGPATFSGDLTLSNSNTATIGELYVGSGAASVVSVGGNTTLTNAGAGTTRRTWFGNAGDVSFTGTIDVVNSSTATNSEVYFHDDPTSVNSYGGDITIESTSASNDGVFFGNAAGSGTLAATRTLTIGGGGFIGSFLTLRNLTQTGATTQTLQPTGTSTYLTIYDCSWGGNVVFSSAQMLTRGTNYSGTASLTKNGAVDNNSTGGNTFTGNAILNNSGSGHFMMGNGSPDTFGGDLDINLSGSDHFYLGNNSAGNTIAGNLTATHTGTGGTSHIYLSNNVASTLDITGTTTLTNNASGSSCNIYLGNTGDVTLGSSLSMTNAVSGAAGTNYIANADGSVVTIAGNTTIINSGSGTTKRTYLGEQGDVTFNGTLSITNSSNATNSEVYCNNNVNSVNAYNQDITLEVTHASSDGILFGNSNGNGTLAATRTISIGGGGFIGSFLTLRNFTQVGATAQTLQPTGTTTYMTLYDCNWGGDIDFSSAQMLTRGTTYSGTASLEKTGATDNSSAGGNTFVGNATLTNSGSGYFLMGNNGNPDTFSADLDMFSTASDHMYLAYNSTGNTVAGNFTATNSGTGTSHIYLSDQLASTLTITGTAVITNSSSGTTNHIYVGNVGDITFGNSLTITNSSSSTSGMVYLADDATSTISVAGNTIAANSGAGGTKRIYLGNAGPVTFSGDVTLSNSNTATTGEVYIGNGSASIISISGNTTLTNDGAGTTRRAWLGNGGDVSFGGTVSVTNNSTATNSEVYFHDDATSLNTYAGDITLVSGSASNDGIRFGASTGSGTLAATRTISIGGGGFLGSTLYFRNFTQVGATAQTLQPAGPTTYMTIYDCNWGGDIIFSSAQMLTRGTTYSGTASLTKTGATDNNSTGGNTFTGNAILNNSGSGHFQMGNGSPDTFGADLDINLSGSDHFYLAYNSPGNTVAGNLTATHSGTGTSYLYLSDQSAATLAITGTAVITNSASGITNYIYVGNAGDLTIGSSLTLTNSSTSTTGQIYLADDATSSVSVTGNTIATNSGAGGTKRIYLGNAGPATFGGDVTLSNSNTATTGELYLGNGVASIISVSGNTTLTNDGAGTTRRAWLGNGGDVSFGGTISVTNNSTATNSEVYFHDDATSVNTYAGDITLSSNSADCDGVYFGNSTGSGTLAATRTISIGGGGFLADILYLRNFTQVGATAQTLQPAGPTTYMTLYDCNWGGDIVFSSAQILTRGTTYSGTASLTKTGATDNQSQGGNTFTGNATLANSGSGYFLMGSGSPDTFDGDLDMINTASDHLYLAYNSAGNTVAGNFTATNAGTGTSNIFLSNLVASTLSITGTTVITNSASGVSNSVYIGDEGDVTLGSTLDITNSASGTSGQVFLADDVSSEAIVPGVTTVINNGTGGTKNIYLGNAGDVTFGSNLTITNSTDGTSGQVFLASGAASVVTVAGNATSTNSGTNGTKNVYLGNSGDVTFSGDLTITNSTNSTTGQTFLADDASSVVSVGGNTIATNSGAGTAKRIYLGNDGPVSFGGDLTLSNSNTATTGELYVGDGSASIITIAGNTTLTNDGSGTTRRAWLGNAGDVSFGGTLSITNNSDATNSEVYLQDDATSVNVYSGNIILEGTETNCDGVLFGNSTGSGTLAATRTISIGGGGFLGRALTLRNFTQVGPTAQTLQPAGSVTYLTIYDCNWGGDIIFSSAQMLTRGTTYSGTASLEKTGATDNSSAGGNTFVGNATLTNSGSGYFLMGNGSSDTFSADLDMFSTASDHMYLGYNSGGNAVAGNFTATNSGTGTSHIYLGDQSASTLAITGTAVITNSSSGTTNYIYVGNAGDITFGSSLTLTNSSTSTTGNIYLADDASSTVSVAGNTIATNSGAGGTKLLYLGNVGPATFSGDLSLSNSNTATVGEIYLASNAASVVSIIGNTTLTNDGAGTTRRTYLGSSGDVSFGGTLAITNSSKATNSQVYCNNAASSVNTYAGNITLESTSASTDGILFGNSSGSGTLAATRTITIGGGGFIAGNLTLRNFTQVGATAQALHPTGTTIMLIDDSNWGGDVDFSSPGIDSEGTTYSGTASLEKTGSTNDRSSGGNTFVGNATIIHSGSGYWRFGEGTTDAFNANLDLIHSGTNSLFFAYSGAGHLVSGDLTATNSGTGVSYLYVGNATTSTLTVNGTTAFVNSGSGSDVRTYAGNSGDVTFNDDVTITNSASGNQGLIYMGSGTTSEVTVNGNTTVTNSGVLTTKRVFLGNQGDVTYNGTLSISNSSTATNSQVFCNYEDNSTNTYNGNITMESTSASNDGVLFGNSGGAGTLTAGNTISIGGGGFIGSTLYFRDFTQTGITAQTLEPTGITTFTLYESNWGGDVTFSSARLTSRSCIYSSAASLEKNGASNDDWYGSNTFNGATTITHSGTGRWRVSSSVGDVYADDVSYIKTGSGTFEPARNGTSTYAGNINFNLNSLITFATNNGIMEMIGTSAQSINDLGASTEPRFRRLVLNNPNDEITLNTPIEISTSVTFTQGNMITTDANLLTIRDEALALTASDASYVRGPIEKVGEDDFTFPVGDSGVYRPMSISGGSGRNNSTAFKGSYFEVNPDTSMYSRYSREGTLDHVSANEYWILDRTSGTATVAVTLSWESNSGTVDDLSELRVAKWNSISEEWEDEGNGGTTGNTTEGTIITSSAVSSFSPFTLSSTTSNNPLPIELVSFDAQLQNGQVELSWITATEINNDYFTVEKSLDGKTFEVAGIVQGAGNSIQQKSYSLIDQQPYLGISYYRLKQTDFDGEFNYEGIVSIENDFNNKPFKAKMYPNPTSNGQVFIELNYVPQNPITLSITSLSGKEILKQVLSSDFEANQVLEITLKQLPSGVYILNAFENEVPIVRERLMVR